METDGEKQQENTRVTGGIEREGVRGGGGWRPGWRRSDRSQAHGRVEEPHSKPCQSLEKKQKSWWE